MSHKNVLILLVHLPVIIDRVIGHSLPSLLVKSAERKLFGILSKSMPRWHESQDGFIGAKPDGYSA
jgi:hypothetical protein